MRYIGSKNRVLGFIDEVITTTYGDYSNAIMSDLFAGTCAVSKMFKAKGATVISNDYMHFSYALQIAMIKLNEYPQCQINYHDALKTLNEIAGVKGFFFREYTLEGSGVRNYFSSDNAQKIDAICLTTQEWLDKGYINEDMFFLLKASLIDAVTKVSNTSGTYGSFLKIDDQRKYKELFLEEREMADNGHNNQCFCANISDIIENVNGDILYLDPPYNNRQYPPYYHILETVTLYDNPNIYGKTGRRHYEDKLSLFCMKESAIDAMIHVIAMAQFSDIYISYSTDGIMPYKELCERLREYGNVECFFKQYRRYKSNSNGSIEESGKLKEIIIYVKKG